MVSFRIDKKERAYLKAEMARRNCAYMGEAIREMLGLPRSTPTSQPIPLLDQIEIDTPQIAQALHQLIDREDEERRLITRIATQLGVPRSELTRIGEEVKPVTRQEVVKQVVDLPEGYFR